MSAWRDIQGLTDMQSDFNNEILHMDGKTLRIILQKTAKFGISHYLALQNDCHLRFWLKRYIFQDVE